MVFQPYPPHDVFVSFSGGKDSTVLKHIVENMGLSVKSIYIDTGLEYPSIRDFVKSFGNVEIIYPKITFLEVIKKYGYPVISKEVSEAIEYARKGSDSLISKIEGTGRYENSPYSLERYSFLLNAPFKISAKCCKEMKKNVSIDYSKKNLTFPLIATLADESKQRKTQWIKAGCNIYDKNRAKSNPMSFWTENDVLEYIRRNNLRIAEPYGQCRYDHNGNCGKLILTGIQRTGCAYCLFGARKKGDDRLIFLKNKYPRQYDYVMNGGEFNSETGLWEPNKKGLGLKFVIDWINSKLRNRLIEY